MGLTTLFGNIADAIREKDGTKDPIPATSFPERILNIPSGIKYLAGRDWHEIKHPDLKLIRSLAYGGGVFVAVSELKIISSFFYSSDKGKTWVPANAPVAAVYTSIAYGDGVFFAVSEGRYGAYSKNGGQNWSRVVIPSSNWDDIAYGGGVFVAVSYKGADESKSKAAYSSDKGKTWTVVDIPKSNFEYKIAYGNGAFVAISGEKVIYSEDGGITWSEENPKDYDGDSIAYGDGVFVSPVPNFGSAYSEDNGKTWTVDLTCAMPAVGGSYSKIVYGNGIFVAITPYFNVAYSTDNGRTWEAGLATEHDSFTLTYGGGIFMSIHWSNTDASIFYSFTGNALPATEENA